jgi:integrin beta 3
MTYNGKSDTYLNSPTESDGGDLLLDAWRVCLAQALDKQRHEWQRHTELMTAQSAAIIGQLEAKVATLEARIVSRLSELKDGPQGEPGPAGPQGERGEQGPVGEIGSRGEQGERGERGEQGERGQNGEQGEKGAQGEAGETGSQGDQGSAGEQGQRGETGERGSQGEIGAQGPQGERGYLGERGETGPPGPQGLRGDKGEQGASGLLPMVRAWIADGISYRGDVVICDGGTWQAQKDTAQKPPHRDWLPLCAAGRDATSPVVRGTFDPEQRYGALNIVAMNGSSFIARCDDPGECPGDGWQLIVSCGRAGKPGPKGERGERGLPGAMIVRWSVDRAAYSITPVMSDGSTGAAVNVRAIFEQYHEDSDG